MWKQQAGVPRMRTINSQHQHLLEMQHPDKNFEKSLVFTLIFFSKKQPILKKILVIAKKYRTQF